MVSHSSEHRRFADQAFQDSLNQLEAFLTESAPEYEESAIAHPDPDQALAQWEAAVTDLDTFLEADRKGAS